MSKSTFAVILFGLRSHSEIAEVVLGQVPSVRRVQIGASVNIEIGALAFEQVWQDASEPMIIVYPNSTADSYADIYDAERTVLSVYGCDPEHEIIQALLSKFGGIYEMKDKDDWMIVERHKEPHELPDLVHLTLSEECRMQMAG